MEVKKRKKRQRIFKCGIEGCAEKFSTNDELKKHQESHRKGKEALFKCTQCANTYQTIGGLKQHLKNHDGGKFMCNVCKKHLYIKVSSCT